ncbi:unnamed protein product [Leptidea sinapis]|uniref:Uncharacterized protein n=1 Tax=Leptidea sinapis TaxID=189913 RepID=A0A5E4QV30_9NEOP|nr:unnamed protein product [Leptidea sinapis]
MKSAILILVSSIVYTVSSMGWYTYKFGTDVGDVIYTGQAHILRYSLNTQVPIKVPDGKQVSYLEINVESYSAPKVYYNNETQVASISFLPSQLTESDYTIVVRGVDANTTIDKNRHCGNVK